jgi:hypothetical protein
VSGAVVPNPEPNTPSSPIFSSVLAIHFGDHFVERRTDGFTLTLTHQQALAEGKRVRLSNGDGDKITLELVANFPNFTPNPLPGLPNNVRSTNPFDLVLVRDSNGRDRDKGRHDDDKDRCETDQVYVTDGGQNLIWKVDVNSGAFSMLAVFPPVANPVTGIGGPFVEAVPTGIAHFRDELLVTLFRGFPFPLGASVVERVDPLTGNHAPFITELKSAIDVIPLRRHHDSDFLVLQHDSFGPPPFPTFSSPGLLLRFETPVGSSVIIADCLTRPTSMALNRRTGNVYITELGGNVVSIPVLP